MLINWRSLILYSKATKRNREHGSIGGRWRRYPTRVRLEKEETRPREVIDFCGKIAFQNFYPFKKLHFKKYKSRAIESHHRKYLEILHCVCVCVRFEKIPPLKYRRGILTAYVYMKRLNGDQSVIYPKFKQVCSYKRDRVGEKANFKLTFAYCDANLQSEQADAKSLPKGSEVPGLLLAHYSSGFLEYWRSRYRALQSAALVGQFSR